MQNDKSVSLEKTEGNNGSKLKIKNQHVIVYATKVEAVAAVLSSNKRVNHE